MNRPLDPSLPHLPPPLPPAAVVVRQARAARMHRLVAPMPALVRVRRGVKEVLAPEGPALTIAAPAMVLMPEGLGLTITNQPDAGGLYLAEALPLPRPVLERAWAARARPVRPAPLIVPPLPPEAVALFDALLDPAAQGRLPGAIRLARLEELAIWLAEAGALLAPPAPPRLTDRLRDLLGRDPAAPWSAARATLALAMSEATLRRHLAAEGTGFAETLRDLRLTHALALLQTTALPVARVAEESGYASPQQFARAFRARWGLSPREIRAETGQIARGGAKLARRGADAAAGAG